MTVRVKLHWTNPSVQPANQVVEVDLGDGNGFLWVTHVSPSAEHEPGVTLYEYTYDANLAFLTILKFRIRTIGAGGAAITGTEISIEVPGNSDIIGVTDLKGTVEVS